MKFFIGAMLALTTYGVSAHLVNAPLNGEKVCVTSLKWVGDPDCRPGSCPNGIHHVPGMMPNYPTAAVLWPRIIRVECVMEEGTMKCDYPARSPDVRRGEYILYEPVFKNEPVQQVIIQQAPAEVIVKEVVKEVTIIKEVPPKQIRE